MKYYLYKTDTDMLLNNGIDVRSMCNNTRMYNIENFKETIPEYESYEINKNIYDQLVSEDVEAVFLALSAILNSKHEISLRKTIH